MSRLFHAQTRRRALMVAGAIAAQVTAAVAQDGGRRGNNGDDCRNPQPNPPPDFFCAPCFLAGTAILTPQGERPVEAIRVGDRVQSSAGPSVVSFFGHFQRRATLTWRPVRIAAGAIAEGVPCRDLVVTPDHALFIDGMLVPAGDLVNGVTVTELPLSSILHTFFHVELERHDVILAEGAWAESLRPVHGHAVFDNDDGERDPDPERLRPFAPIVGVKGGREAVQAIWLGLRGRAFDPRLAAIQERLWRRAQALAPASAA
ncbi:Hint domain-containing protein [Alsobacter sp. R-9]